MLAIVYAIKLWRLYVEEQKFTVITDHASLEYIKTQNTLSRHQARWLEVLQSHTFDIRYKPGKTNLVADTLSRQPQLINISAIKAYDWDLIEKYQQDKYFGPILQALQSKNKNNSKLKAKVNNYELRNNQIYLKDQQRLVIPKDKILITN